MCSSHWNRWRRHGDPLAGNSSRKETLEEAFSAKVKIPTVLSDCWIWTGSVDHSGYGQINKGKITYRAHRISYEMFIGPIPDGLLILHSCDNPKCVNPAHLRAGTCQDNTDDMIKRQRAYWQQKRSA